MYRIEFLNEFEKISATHFIIAADCPIKLMQVEVYCLMIFKEFINIAKWNIYSLDGKLLLSGIPR